MTGVDYEFLLSFQTGFGHNILLERNIENVRHSVCTVCAFHRFAEIRVHGQLAIPAYGDWRIPADLSALVCTLWVECIRTESFHGSIAYD